VDYHNWRSGEPNDFGSGEDCTVMWTNGKWNDISCDSELEFVCGIPEVTENEER
jgi:mannose-binding lectin